MPIPPSDGPASARAGSSPSADSRPLDLSQVPGQVLRESAGPTLNHGCERCDCGTHEFSQFPEHCFDELIVRH